MEIQKPEAEGSILEPLNEYAGFFIKKGDLLESGTSSYQQYEVWESPFYGKMFRLDGCCMTSEKDEFFYHENLIHVPGMTHPGLEQALIIGGGDGGSAEELLKYPTMKNIVMVELDAKVIEIAREHFQSVHQGALDDPRLEIQLEDGGRYVREAGASSRRFDLIVLDLTDPVGPAESLYTEDFFHACKKILAPAGALSLHIGAPFFQPEQVTQIVHRLRAVFQQVHPYFMYIPLYGSQWGMACASDTLNPRSLTEADVERSLMEKGINTLRYYNGAMHIAQFALPNYLRTLLA